MRRSCKLLLFLTGISAFAQTNVDSIWSARYVVTMDPQRRVTENGAVGIRTGRLPRTAENA